MGEVDAKNCALLKTDSSLRRNDWIKSKYSINFLSKEKAPDEEYSNTMNRVNVLLQEQ